MPLKQRKDYIDRLKGIGILCVVIGHFIAVFREDVPFLNVLYLFIYLFHMPLFSFLSGLTGKCNLPKIALQSLLIYLVINTLLNFLTGGKENLIKMVIGPYGLMWYLFCLMIWQLSVPVLDFVRKRTGDLILLALLFVLSLASGFINISGVFVKLVVFYFYFALGYVSKNGFHSCVEAFRKSEHHAVIRAAAGGALLLCFIVLLIVQPDIPKEVIVQSDSYRAGNYTVLHRLLFYAASLVLGTGVVLFCSDLRSKTVGRMGLHSLSVYILHAFIQILLSRSGLNDHVRDTGSSLLMIAYSIVLAVVTALLLSAEPVSKAVNGIFGCPYRIFYQKRKAAETIGQNGEKQ